MALNRQKVILKTISGPLLPVYLKLKQSMYYGLPLVMLRVLSPLATKSYSATNRLGSFSLGPDKRFSLEFHRAASLKPCGSKSDTIGLCKASAEKSQQNNVILKCQVSQSQSNQ